MAYEVRVVSDRRGRREFLRLPFALRRGDMNWVPPVVSEIDRTLDSERNPYFAAASLGLFLGLRDGIPAARLAVVLDRRYEAAYGRKAAWFGFFEAGNDPAEVRVLFDAAEAYARSRGARILEGPFNPNHYSEIGLQVDHFGEAPAFFQPYNPDFYPVLLESLGYRATARLTTMKNPDFARTVRELGGRKRNELGTGDFTVRPARLGDLDRELDILREVNNDAFAGQWPFLPLSREEYAFSAKALRRITRPNLVLIGEHRGRPAAVIHAALDINPLLKTMGGKSGPLSIARFFHGRRRVRNLIVFTIAIKKEFRHTRLFAVMLQALVASGRDFDSIETTWISPGNTAAVAAAEKLGMTRDRSFALYAKELPS